jgi:hypothetical protein
MTINAAFKARLVMPGEEFDADEIPAESLAAFCARPVGYPRATMLEAPAPVPSAPLPARSTDPVAVVAPPAPVAEPTIEEKPRRGWKRKK